MKNASYFPNHDTLIRTMAIFKAPINFKYTFIGATRCSIDSCKWLEYLLWSLGKCFIRLQHIKIFETVQKSSDKIVSKEAPENNYYFARIKREYRHL